jgi:hypothetical protein
VYSTKWPDFCNDFCRIRGAMAGEIGTRPRCGRWEGVMDRDSNGKFGILIGGVVAVIAAIFILTGGELGGKKTVEGDQDLPPISTTDK